MREITDQEHDAMLLANKLRAGTIMLIAKTRTGYRKFLGQYTESTLNELDRDVALLKASMQDTGDDNK